MIRVRNPLPLLTILASTLVLASGPNEGTRQDVIDLDPGYQAAFAAEPDLDTADVLAAINRWTGDLYGDHPDAALAYAWACLIDPTTAEIAGAWREAMAGAETVADRVRAIDRWNEENLCHTQMLETFADRPGRDPWGLTTDGSPTYRKLLPSEMKAMRGLTGRISGKCMTLANLLIAGLVHVGVDPDDLVLVHVQMPGYQHGAAMASWDGTLIRTNNHRIGLAYGAGSPPVLPPAPMPVLALYNHRFYSPGGFTVPVGALNEGALDGDAPLMPQFVARCCGGAPVPEAAHPADYPFADPPRFREVLFTGDHAGAGAAPWLAKYAYQSLYVKHPGHYLRASLREPHARELARELTDPAAMLRWLRDEVAEGSIFPDSGERIMTADQVVVFRTGGPADRGLLLLTLLAHHERDGELLLDREAAVVHAGDDWWDMRTLRRTEPLRSAALRIAAS
jgi:hypothetical protein